jgi:putative peptidoglycan lipid II flippase
VETLEKQGKSEAERLARKMLTFASIVLALVTMAGILFSPWIVRLIAPGFTDSPEKFGLTVYLTRVMFPYIFFISLVALASGILNSLGRFAAPAAAPVVLNLSMIGGVALGCALLGAEPYYALAWGVVVAGILQLLMQIPFMTSLGIRIRADFDFGHPAMKRIGRLFIPAALGGAVYQVNVLIGTILASMLPSGSVSWLYYADRLVELPLGVFAIALGTAVMPSMSRQAASGDLSALSRSVSYALRLIWFLIIPASVGLILLREPIIAVLFQRGQFTAIDTQASAYALLWYTVGLWAFSGLKVANQAFFSMKDTKTPVWTALASVAVNLVGGLILMRYMDHGGLALATSLAAAFNFLLLLAILTGRLGVFEFSETIKSVLLTCVATAAMGGFLIYARTLGDWDFGLTTGNGIALFGSVFGGVVIFGGFSYILGSREAPALLRIVRPRP